MSDWLFGRVEAVDPLPFHGLVYTVPPSRVTMLDPRDGRPSIQVPPAYGLGSSDNQGRLHSYFALRDGVLWDIGRPDPETPPAIEAAGGRCLGRRLVNITQYHPARLADRTRQLQVRATLSAGVLTFYWHERNVGSETGFASYSLGDFGVDWNTVRVEESGGLAKDKVATPSVAARALDASPDGTRRLFGITLGGLAGTNGWATSMVGIVEVVLSADAETGAISAAATTLRTATDLLGTLTRDYGGIARTLTGVGTGYPACRTDYVAREIPGQVTGTDGYSSRYIRRTGYVVGALYDPAGADGIRYLTVDYEEVDQETATHTKASWDSSKPNTEGGYCEPWPPGTAPPEPPREQTWSQFYRFDLTIRYGDYHTSGWLQAEWSRSSSQPAGGELSYSGTSTRTASGGFSNTVSSSGTGDGASWIVITALSNAGWDSSAMYLPRAVYRSHDVMLALVSRRSFLSMAVYRHLDGDPGGWWHPLVTPSGVVGEIVEYPIVRFGTGLTPNFGYGAAYNPITGEGLRNCDVPGWQIEGYL